MHQRPSSRVYAGTTGQCLLRDTTDVDEAERSRAVRDFEAGVKLVVDADRAEVRGVVPVVRSAPEAFVFVVDVSTAANPIRAFYRAVETVVDSRDGWSLKDESQAARAVRTVKAATRSNDEPTPPGVRPSGTKQQYANLGDAVTALDRTFETDDRASVPEIVVIADTEHAAHIGDGALYVTLEHREQDHTAEGGSGDAETTPGAARWSFDRAVRLSLAAFVLGTVLWWSFDGLLGVVGALLATGATLGAAAISAR